MSVSGTKTLGKGAATARRKQVNIRLEVVLYQTLQALARQERRSVPQTALHLLEAGLRQRVGGQVSGDDTPSREIAALATAGGAFDWLAEEPDLYDDTCGEPL
jgi:hypothetical protein